MKNFIKKLATISAIIMVLALIFSIDPVAQQVAKVTAWPVEKIKIVAKTVLMIAIGVYLISSGIAALAVPVVGIALIAVGLALVGMAVWPLFKKQPEVGD